MIKDIITVDNNYKTIGQVIWDVHNIYTTSSFLTPKEIIVPEATNLYSLIVILHELGHIATQKYFAKSVNVPFKFARKWKVLSEIKAWQYVFQCTKPKYHLEILKEAHECLMRWDLTREQIATYMLLKGGNRHDMCCLQEK